MKIFNREKIENFAQEMQKEHYENAFSWLEVTFTDIIEKLRKNTPIITNDYEFVLVGDFSTLTFTQNSEIDVFITFNSPQLELNSIKLSNDKFKQFWLKLKKAYAVSKQERKNTKRRKRKQEKQIKKEFEIPVNKYTMLNLKKQLAIGVTNKIDASSSVFPNNKGFKIVDRNTLGIDINVYPAIKSENTYKVYLEDKGKFVCFDFTQLEQNITEKVESVGEIYFDLVRVFKNLYFNLNSSILPSPYLIESLIYNCPDLLFDGYNFYEIFTKILNYLTNTNISNFVLINDKAQNLFTSNLIPESISNINSFIKKIDLNI